MKIIKKLPLKPRGRVDDKKHTTREAIRDAYTNGPKLEVQIIPAKRDAAESGEPKRLRVCAYCRVSTDEDSQGSSYELQVQNYTQMIQNNPDWEFAGIYADDAAIIGLNQKPEANGRRFSPFSLVSAHCKANGGCNCLI